MRADLTKRQKQFLDYVKTFISEHGYSPSIREIQAAFNLKSTKGVKDHIDRLVDKGYLLRKDGAARTISMPSRRSDIGTAHNMAPIIGRVAAGLPILAAENEEGQMPVPDRFKDVEGMFWLKVHGDSMIEDGILDGDFVLVNPVPFVEQGTTAVVMVEDEATVKHFYRRGDNIRLVPANENYRVMEFCGSECAGIRIAGKVDAIFRFTC